MEHPGRNWNRIECRFNQYLSKLLPRQVLRWLWVLTHTAAGGYILLQTLFGSVGYIVCLGYPIHELCKEKIYDADPAVVNPANEGRLVRLTGQLTTSEWVTDPLTGVQAQAPWLVRGTGAPLPRIEVSRSLEIDDIELYAKEWQLGAFRISHYRQFYPSRDTLLTADKLQFTQPAEGYQVTPKGTSILLSTAQGEPLRYITYHTSIEPVYIIARQCGNQLLLDDPAASFSFYQHHFIFSATNAETLVLLLILGSGMHFTMLCLAFSCLRSAMWHATGGKDLFRLPLCLVSGLVVGISCCLCCGIFLLTGGNTSRTVAPGIGFLVAALVILTILARQWMSRASR